MYVPGAIKVGVKKDLKPQRPWHASVQQIDKAKKGGFGFADLLATFVPA